MKVKLIWETADIEPGMYFIRNSSPLGSTDLSFASTVCFKLGFSHISRDNPYVLISIMTDGMIYLPMASKADVVTMLNADEHGYRPLTKAEYIAILNSTNQGFIEKPVI